MVWYRITARKNHSTLSPSEQVISKVQMAKLICSFWGAQEQPPHVGRHSNSHLRCMQPDIAKSIQEPLLGLRWTTEGLCPPTSCQLNAVELGSQLSTQEQVSWFFLQAGAHSVELAPLGGRAMAPSIRDKVAPFTSATLTIAVPSKWLPLQSATQKIN